MEKKIPIDVVFTWVDPHFREWREEKRIWENRFLKRNSNGNGINISWFSSFEEIRYGLRSVHQYLPWVRHIYLVTNHGTFPQWLDHKHPKISIVDYRTLLPAKSLPTYNSNAIEAFLYRIPRLSEHFIYFNDDLLVLKPLYPRDFIDFKNEKFIYPLETDIFFTSFQKSKILAYLEDKILRLDGKVIHSRYYTMNALNIPYDGDSTAHCPKILSKTQCRKFNRKFKKYIDDLLKTKFRTSSAFTYLEALYQYSVKKLESAKFSKKYRTRIINLLNLEIPNSLQIGITRFNLKKYTFLAIQDVRSKIKASEEEKVLSFLNELCPIAAPWERVP